MFHLERKLRDIPEGEVVTGVGAAIENLRDKNREGAALLKESVPEPAHIPYVAKVAANDDAVLMGTRVDAPSVEAVQDLGGFPAAVQVAVGQQKNKSGVRRRTLETTFFITVTKDNGIESHILSFG
jgi:hypothetical protein